MGAAAKATPRDAGPVRSLWSDTATHEAPLDSSLGGDTQVDVAIVGAGYTGLWAAYYLAAADPHLRIVVLEKDHVGFGASGRNGGWCSAIFPASLRKIATASNRAEAVRLQRAMNDTVVEVGRVTELETISCGFHQGGYASVARNDAQWQRAQDEVSGWRTWGLGSDHMRLLDAHDAVGHVRATRVLGATFTPHCAVVQPLDLVRGLAEAVRRRGVTIHSGTTVQNRPHP